MNPSPIHARTEPANAPEFPAVGLNLDRLTLHRGTHLVLGDLDLVVEPGTLCLVRGPNGAGKSTLLAALAGLLAPTSGQLSWTGTDPEARPWSHIHFLGHDTALKSVLTVSENLEFWCRFYGGDGETAPALARCGLTGLGPIEVGHLSAGQKKRVSLARILCVPRPVWLLDEPTATLDDKGQALVAAMVGAHVASGGTVIAATHHDIDLPPGRVSSTLNLAGP